jgi:hypothetical protein
MAARLSTSGVSPRAGCSERSFCSVANADLDPTLEDDHVFAAIGPVETPDRTRRGSTDLYSVDIRNGCKMFNAWAWNEFDVNILKMRVAVRSGIKLCNLH